MFSAAGSYGKLKTNLRLAVNRLKLLEKKKTELAQKARKEIADYIQNGKYERAKIRVEHIIREDYLVEAMELVEMYCDLLLARFGLIQQMKTLDGGLAEAISSLIWVAPRLQTDVAELKIIAEQLTQKYGKQYALACRDNAVATVNEKLMHKLGVQAPPKILVERYLIEIAKSHNVPYEPDPEVMRQDEVMSAEALLLDFEDNNGPKGGPGGGGGGGGGMGNNNIGFVVGPPQVQYPQPYQPFNYPGKDLSASGPPPLPNVPPSAPFPSLNKLQYQYQTDPQAPSRPNVEDFPVPPYDEVVKSPSNNNSIGLPQINVEVNDSQVPKPLPAPRSKNVADTLPELPAVPTGSLVSDSNGGAGVGGESNVGDDVDFDDLAKRFEALKKKK